MVDASRRVSEVNVNVTGNAPRSKGRLLILQKYGGIMGIITASVFINDDEAALHDDSRSRAFGEGGGDRPNQICGVAGLM
jgi:hypothetical protein